ncbi:MAG TPA: methyltransferase, partial [Pirellulales bacterium]|nr:methyltransferase [Pirellulales bacterium]
VPPETDPTPIFEIFRGNHGTELLAAAVAHLNVFGRLAGGAKDYEALRRELDLSQRAAAVLFAALRAMGLLSLDQRGRLELTPLAREHLLPGGEFYVGDYVGLAANSPGVLAMVERLHSSRPAGAAPDEAGAAFIYREGLRSAMDQEATARHLTLSLAGRGKNVAPLLAERVPLDETALLVDVGGGSGIYSVALLRKYPRLRAIVWDRPEVLKVAEEFAREYGVADRLECRPGDMFADPVPGGADAILLSNILHDWDLPECNRLVERCAAALPPGGRLLIHDVFLNDAHDGPLPIALYSAALFSLTEGRAYSGAEFRQMLAAAGLSAAEEIAPTLVPCGVLIGTKRDVIPR